MTKSRGSLNEEENIKFEQEQQKQIETKLAKVKKMYRKMLAQATLLSGNDHMSISAKYCFS